MGAAVFEVFPRAIIDAHDGEMKKRLSEPPGQQPSSQASASEAEETAAVPQAEAEVEPVESPPQG